MKDSPLGERKCTESHRVLHIDCKAKPAITTVDAFIVIIREVQCTQRILRPLSRIRAELAGEFSLAIR